MASTGQIIMVRSILRNHKFSEEEKNEIVSQFTGGRTTHISDMDNGEVNALKSFFQPDSEDDKSRNRMIRNMMAIAHDMKWKLADGRADRDRVSEWCENMGPTKQPIDKISNADLPKVLTIFKKVQKSLYTDF